LSRYNVAFILTLIVLLSLGLKLYTIDFSIPVNSDNMIFTLDAISYSNGEIFISAKKNPGWPMFASLFTHLIDSNKFIDYSNLMRVLSMGISLLTILPMYIFARKFFNEKYSIVAASLFAFEPHLNFNSNLALSEPLYIFVMIISFVLILNKNEKFIYFSFALAGILWWIRLEGITLFIVISIIFFLNFRKTSKVIPKYLLCIVIFILVISPNLFLREQQFDDPFYFKWNELIDMKDDKNLQTLNTSKLDIQPIRGSVLKIEQILWGLSIFETLIHVLFPYIIILIPFGIFFSFKIFDQNSKLIKANWIMILVTIGILTIIFTINPDRRYLFQLYPYFIIFSVIPIQRLIEYGSNIFSFDEGEKNIFLIVVVCIIFVLGGLFTTLRFGPSDLIYENEKIEFVRLLNENFDGGILDAGNAIEYFTYSQIVDSEGIFDKNKPKNTKDVSLYIYIPGSVTQTIVSEKSLDELILNGKEDGLKYIAVKKDETFIHLHFLDDVYANEGNYPYLKKVFDSNEKGFQKLKVKVFEIDYKKFANLN